MTDEPAQALPSSRTLRICRHGHLGTAAPDQTWQSFLMIPSKSFPTGYRRPFSKVTMTVPLRTLTSLSVARAICDHWAYFYGPTVSLLTENSPQFTAKFFQAVCAELGIHKVFTTAYHPQSNGKVERYNRTILASLRGYVAARQDDWDDYTTAVTFGYNCRVHASLGMPPFELALTRPSRSLSLQAQPRTEERTPNTLKKEFLERLKTMRLRAGMNLHQAQARYKKNFDRGVSRKNVNLQEGEEAYVHVEVTDVGRNHKLESLVQGVTARLRRVKR
jgi:hypothetical protein